MRRRNMHHNFICVLYAFFVYLCVERLQIRPEGNHFVLISRYKRVPTLTVCLLKLKQ